MIQSRVRKISLPNKIRPYFLIEYADGVLETWTGNHKLPDYIEKIIVDNIINIKP